MNIPTTPSVEERVQRLKTIGTPTIGQVLNILMEMAQANKELKERISDLEQRITELEKQTPC